MKNLTIISLLLMALGLAGCNTTRGFGQDVEAVGDTIEDSAEEASENF